MHHAGLGAVPQAPYDAALRAHMLSVCRLMGAGLALSALSAFAVAGGQGAWIGHGGLGALLAAAPLAMLLLAMLSRPERWTRGGTAAFYWTFTALQGVGLASALPAHGAADVIRALLATAAGFAGLGAWGYAARRDLGGLGAFCTMGLWGLIAVGLLSALTGLHPHGALFGAAGVIVFSGLVAWDFQRIKLAFLEHPDEPERMAYWAALSLYLDALNLFWALLRLFAAARED